MIRRFLFPRARCLWLCAAALCIGGGVCLFSSDLYGATVKQKRKKRMVVVIDEGKSSGVSQGDTVCFFNFKDVEVGCGTVRRVRPQRAFVKVKAPVFRKVRPGFVASYGVGSDGSGASGGGDSDVMLRFRLLSGMTWRQAFQASLPEYKKRVAPYWEESEDNALGTFYSGHGGVEIEAAALYLSAGFRMDVVTNPYEGDQSYAHAQQRTNECARTAQERQQKKLNPCYISWDYKPMAMGGWLQFLYPLPLTPDIAWSFGLGVDVDYSTLTMSAYQRTDRSTTTAHKLLEDVESSLLSVGVRIVPASLSMEVVDGFAVFVAGAIVVGISGEASITDDFTTGDKNLDHSANQTQEKKKYVTEYFADALNHSPAAFGAMIYGGLQFSL